MKKRKFTTTTFSHQMWRYGFFTEQIPPCFTSTQFAENYQELKGLLGRAYSTSPVTLSTYKSGTSRRIISAPNPYMFACTVKFMSEHRKALFRFAASENSESPITFLHSYHDEEEEETINSDLARAVLKAKSEFTFNLRQRIMLAMGYRFRLSIDIATFYDMIYTHSITWAICGKKEAKRMYPEEAKDLRTEDYKFAAQLDKLIRDQKTQETNGILTGPFTSRIFSEIILAAIDKELRGREYIFKRYVDDFKFYFRSESEAQRAVIDIAKVLHSYNLAINQSKIEITEYPFDVESPMRDLLARAKKKSGVYGALNEASRLFLEGEKGAYKYALKMLRKEDVPETDREVVLSMLFNINLVNPKYAGYIIGYLLQSKSTIGDIKLSEIINKELRRSLEEGYEQEVLNLLYFLRALNLHIQGSLLLKAMKLENDFIRVIALDFWVKHKDSVLRDRSEAQRINATVSRIEEDLAGASMDGEHWLLLYESKVNGLLQVTLNVGKTSKFFQEMEKRGISFYHPIRASHSG